jgi:hypothetical protein
MMTLRQGAVAKIHAAPNIPGAGHGSKGECVCAGSRRPDLAPDYGQSAPNRTFDSQAAGTES